MRPPDSLEGESGSTLRFYNPQTTRWNITYVNTCNVTWMEAVRVDDHIVLTGMDDPKMQWSFGEVEPNSFT